MSSATIRFLFVVAASATCPSSGSAATSRQPCLPASAPPDTLVPSTGLPRGWSYGLIVGHDQFRDDLLVPLRWAGAEFGLQVGWEGGSADGRYRASLSIPLSMLEERYGHPGGAMGLEVAYSYDRVVRQLFGEGALAVGGRFSLDQHNGIYFSWDEEHIYWFTAYSLGPRLAWRSGGPLDGTTVTLDVPVAALVSRPPRYAQGKRDPMWDPWFHLTRPHKGLRLSGPPHYAALRAGLELPQRWWGRRFVLSYVLDTSTYDAPARVVTVVNRFGIAHLPGSRP